MHEKSIMAAHPFLWECFLESQTLANSIDHTLDFALTLTEHYEALVSLSIWPEQAALKNTLILQHANHCPQYSVICTLEIALCSIIEVDN